MTRETWKRVKEIFHAVVDLSADERTRLMGSRTGYRDFYSRLKDMPLAVSRETGRLLYRETLADGTWSEIRPLDLALFPTADAWKALAGRLAN